MDNLQQQEGYLYQTQPYALQNPNYGVVGNGLNQNGNAESQESVSTRGSSADSSLSTSYHRDSDNEAGLVHEDGAIVGDHARAFPSDDSSNQLQQSGAFAYDAASGVTSAFQNNLSLNPAPSNAPHGTVQANVAQSYYQSATNNYSNNYSNGNTLPGGDYQSGNANSYGYAQQYQNDYSRQGATQMYAASQTAGLGMSRDKSDYDMQSESTPLPAPDGIENFTVLPVYEPHTNKQQVNCSPELMRCTLRAVPSSKEVLNKARLPFGVLLHPFKDVHQLPVLQVNNIVRCKECRTYINPFVVFLDSRHWRCNVCLRSNDLPEDFVYDKATRTYGDVFSRAEIRSATVEYIAPAEYAVRPPQPAVYVFVLDVTPTALNVDYLSSFCSVLRDNIDRLPGDARKQVAFVTFDSTVHFYTLRYDDRNSASQSETLFRMHVCADLDDLSIPFPSDMLLANVSEKRATICKFLETLPSFWSSALRKGSNATDEHNALGSALTLAQRLVSSIGGRITVFNCSLPSVGPGSLQPREADFRKSNTFTSDTPARLLAPAVDTYKQIGLECSTAQVGVDLFVLGAMEYVDLASLAPAARISSGAVYYYRLSGNTGSQLRKFEVDFKRYLTRKLGFEAVLRLRCTTGVSVQNFFGNFFVRGTDLCNLANVSPDLGCAVHLRIDESLTSYVNATIQCAILYTHAAGERRIRVHTLSVPISQQADEVIQSADQQAIVSLIAKMAAERASTRSLADARDGVVMSLVDVLEALRAHYTDRQLGAARLLTAPHALRLFAVYVLALLKNAALKPTGTSVDERTFALEQIRQLPAQYLHLKLYPAMYCLDVCEDGGFLSREVDLSNLPKSASTDAPTYPPLIRLSARYLSTSSLYLVDCGDALYIYMGERVRASLLLQLFGTESVSVQQCADMTDLPALNNLASNYVRRFVRHLRSRRAFGVTFAIVKEDAGRRTFLSQFLVEDRNEVVNSQANQSYVDFLSEIREQLHH